MLVKRLTCGLIVIFPIISVLASSQHYIADVGEAQWSLKSSHLQCRLSHPIPGYGEAYFERRSSKPTGFVLTTWKTLPQPFHAKLLVQKPSWKAHKLTPVQRIAQLNRSKVHEVVLPQETAHQLLDVLYEGMMPQLRYKDEEQRRVVVSLSTVNFSEAYKSYLTCVKELWKEAPERLASKVLYFPASSKELLPLQKAYLKKLAKYTKEGMPFKAIMISGHTDTRGLRVSNKKLSLERAKQVKAHLVELGVSKDKIATRGFGEVQPIYSNTSTVGRDKNRRVEIKVIQ